MNTTNLIHGAGEASFALPRGPRGPRFAGMLQLVALLVLAGSGLAAAPCGSFATAHATAHEMTDEDLGRMVVPENELGLISDELSVSFEGPFDADGAGLSCDDVESRRSAETLGYETGYQLAYELSDPGPNGTNGFNGASTEVTIWRDVETAEAAFDLRRSYMLTPCPPTVDAPQTEKDNEEFETAIEADEATGITYTVVPTRGDARLYSTVVVFRFGRVLGQAVVHTDTGDDRTADAVELAARLRARIGEVVAMTAGRATGQHLPLELTLTSDADSEAAEVRFISAAAQVVTVSGMLPAGMQFDSWDYGVAEGECAGPFVSASYLRDGSEAGIDSSIPLSIWVSVQAHGDAATAERCSNDRRDGVASADCDEDLSQIADDWPLMECSVDRLAGRAAATNGWALERDAMYALGIGADDGQLYTTGLHQFRAEVRVGAYTVVVETIINGDADYDLNFDLIGQAGRDLTDNLAVLTAVAYSPTGEPPVADVATTTATPDDAAEEPAESDLEGRRGADHLMFAAPATAASTRLS